MIDIAARRYCPKITEDVRQALSDHPELIQQLLFNRGIHTKEEAEYFLSPNFDTGLHDPFLLTDMEKAAKRILTAIKKDEHIVIYSDYDCDGIPGGVLLHDFFTDIGFTNFENYIPHRHVEGYGFNKNAVEKLVQKSTKLIITVDCGITDHEAVEEAKAEGVDVIVTDHHEVGEKGVPDAYAVVNPKRDDAYPFKGLCGTAVAYKLVEAVLKLGREDETIDLKAGKEKWLLDLVGIATIADMVPLTGENRVFAHYGLYVLRKSQRPGIGHLLRKAGGNQRYLTEDDIGFTIAPRINAASRMDDPEDAFHMLRTRDEEEAVTYVAHLEIMNNERKGVVASMTKEAKKKIKGSRQIPNVIVIGNPEWRPSLAGLVANALVEEYKRPAFVWGRDGKDILKGSCRSDGEVSVMQLMQKAKDVFLEFGGHHASGGFAVDYAHIHTLQDVLSETYGAHKEEIEDAEHIQMVDAQIDINDVNDAFTLLIEKLGPYGIENPKPIFEIKNVTPFDVHVFGKTKNHTKLKMRTQAGFIDAIAFFKVPEDFTVFPEKQKEHTLIAHVERSFFMGRRETRLRIIDVL